MSEFLKIQKVKRIRRYMLNKNNNTLLYDMLPKKPLKIISISDFPPPLSRLADKYFKEVVVIEYTNISYNDLVNGMVHEKYSGSEEFAILRKAISGITSEFITYNAYVEECKTQAKAFIAERDEASL